MSKERKFTILGNPQSKANSRQLVIGTSKSGKRYTRSIKSQKALEYEQSCIIQLEVQNRRRKPLNGPVGIEITIWYQSKLSDLDPSIILDCMQKAKVYDNDRQVMQMVLFKEHDKNNPRCEILVYEL